MIRKSGNSTYFEELFTTSMEEHLNETRQPEKWDIAENFPPELIERIEAECYQLAIADSSLSIQAEDENFHIKHWNKVFDRYYHHALTAFLPFYQQGNSIEGLILAIQFYRHSYPVTRDTDAEIPDSGIHFYHFILTILELLYAKSEREFDIQIHRQHPLIQHLIQTMSGD